jgi:hypothetical protein
LGKKEVTKKMAAKWFYDVEVIVDGAVSLFQTFTSDEILDAVGDPIMEFVAAVENGAIESGNPTEVFVQFHDHEPFDDGEDVCGQFETDLHPTYSWNIPTDVSTVPQEVHVTGWTREDFPHGETWSLHFSAYVCRERFLDERDFYNAQALFYDFENHRFPVRAIPTGMLFRWDRRHD